MSGLNSTVLIGRVATDIGLNYFKYKKGDQTAVTNILVAVPSSRPDKDGKDSAVFIPVTIFGKQAELTAEYVDKGQQVAVEGRITVDEWEKDGEKRKRLKVTAERVTFLGKPMGNKDENRAGRINQEEEAPF